MYFRAALHSPKVLTIKGVGEKWFPTIVQEQILIEKIAIIPAFIL